MARHPRLVGITAAVAVAAPVTALVLIVIDSSRRGPAVGLDPALWPGFQIALAMAWLVPSVVLARRRPELPFGALGLVAAVTHGLAGLGPAVSPDGPWTLWAAQWLVLVEVPIIGVVAQVFPAGRSLPGWRWFLQLSVASGAVAIVAMSVAAGPLPLDQGDATPATPISLLPALVNDAAIPLLAFSGLGCLVPLAVRFRRSVAQERRAVGGVILVVGTTIVVPIFAGLGGRWGEVAAQASTAAELSVIGYIVLRYRVWGLTPMLRRTLRRVVDARDVERRRLRAELHDGVGAGLTSARLKVDAASRMVVDRPARAVEVLGAASSEIGEIVDEVRRLIEGLRPAVLEHTDLTSAVRARASELSEHAPGLTILVTDHGALDHLTSAVEDAAYRVVTEALNNVVRHANAQWCAVNLDAKPAELVVEVADDGVGPIGHGGGIGLATMSARLAELGGYLTTGSNSDGGFSMRAVIPLETAG